jgi:osomolarity two-component system sensor histidine kinase NIK1
MCQNLTTQVRSIATVTTAVARVSPITERSSAILTNQGDLSKMIEIEAEGEMAILKNVS